MTSKIASFLVALIVWHACLAFAFVVTSRFERLKAEDVTAFVLPVLLGILLAALCALVCGRLNKSRARSAGIAIGLVPGAILLTLGLLTLKGIEPCAVIRLIAVPGGVAGGLSGWLSSRIQQKS